MTATRATRRSRCRSRPSATKIARWPRPRRRGSSANAGRSTRTPAAVGAAAPVAVAAARPRGGVARRIPAPKRNGDLLVLYIRRRDLAALLSRPEDLRPDSFLYSAGFLE